MTAASPGPATGSALAVRAGALPAVLPAGAVLHLRPAGLVRGAAARGLLAAGGARLLAGGPLAFTLVEVLVRAPDAVTSAMLPVAATEAWAESLATPYRERMEALLARAVAPRAPLVPAAHGRPLVMGVVNVTPDSFSDGGDFHHAADAVAQGRALAAAGADILDVGGESTRPGALPVAPAEEQARVLPVIRALSETGVPISIDTRNADTMRAALAAGADIVNDVSALTHDSAAAAVVAGARVPVVLMHAQGDPRTMQQNPAYACAPLDVAEALEARIAACEAAGIPRARIAVDPGIGFGKTVAHNLEILARLGVLHGLGCPILLGVSRKSFVARLSAGEPPKGREPGSLAAALAGVAQGVQVIRVHDVAGTVQALKVATAVAQAE